MVDDTNWSEAAKWAWLLSNKVPWQERYPYVHGMIVKYLEANVIAPATITSQQLAKALAPEMFSKKKRTQADRVAHNKIFHILRTLAQHSLKDYAIQLEARPHLLYPSRIVRPIVWSAPNLAADL
jgi:hypothetical protein